MNTGIIPLNSVPMGRKANVTELRSGGMTRRRLLDLGIVDGTGVEPLYRSPSGSPVAYLIRGAVIALRPDISGNIMVSIS